MANMKEQHTSDLGNGLGKCMKDWNTFHWQRHWKHTDFWMVFLSSDIAELLMKANGLPFLRLLAG